MKNTSPLSLLSPVGGRPQGPPVKFQFLPRFNVPFVSFVSFCETFPFPIRSHPVLSAVKSFQLSTCSVLCSRFSLRLHFSK
jgi:hypothetical protein